MIKKVVAFVFVIALVLGVGCQEDSDVRPDVEIDS